ncbi:CLC_0170 family protein [Paenibacillus wynnii]|uniref:CLC_0170 family protein n=1 Tax=Paenibacillus wynnii TaxID=268407 RepID=UPI002793CED8|nr:CLC_0170 family protein [Paenibacillus wynnii]MDQ0195087.1 hypothetical protein [Paenibacillus wynnii]
MFHSFKYLAIAFFASGLLLLMIDSKIYNVSGFLREKKTASIMGWVHLGLCLLNMIFLHFFTK